MKAEFLLNLVKESAKGKEKKIPNDLKCIIVKIKDSKIKFESRLSFEVQTKEAKDGFERIEINGLDFYYLYDNEYCLFFTARPSSEVNTLTSYLEKLEGIKIPWIEGYNFRRKIQEFIAETGIIDGYSAQFKPYKEYTGYGITMKLWGPKSDSVLNDIKTKYFITPLSIKGKLFSDTTHEPILNFAISNDGKLSYKSGRMDLFINLIRYYLSILRDIDKSYTIEPNKIEQTDSSTKVRFGKIFNYFFTNSKGEKVKISKEEKEALIESLMSGGIRYGYLGYLVGENKMNVFDIENNKLILITFFDDRVAVTSLNPTYPTESLKKIHRLIVDHIHPYTKISVTEF